MKKVPRKNPELDLIKVFANQSKLKGLAKYAPEHFAEFGEMARNAVAEGVTAEHRVRGIRAEYIFTNVVTGLGHVLLIKTEDGDAHYNCEDIEIPDFRLVLSDGSQRLVEVKSCKMEGVGDQLKLSDAYVQRLRRYAELVNTELRIAIFWEGLRHWTLNGLGSFEPGLTGEKKWSIDFCRSVAASEMQDIGDWFVMTHAPLVLRLVFDPDRSEPVVKGRAITAMTERAEVLSHDKVLSGVSANIATTLIWYGGWVEGTQQSIVQDGKLVSIDFPVGPNHPDDDDAYTPGDQYLMGPVSSIISRAFLESSRETIRPEKESPILRPGYMGHEFVPEDWLSMDLEISIVKMFVEPSYDVKKR